MIPVSLTLRNFMSYGDEPQTLAFDGIHVACLSGDNGNGKSALLDAITWALWGKSRVSGHSNVVEDDLIRRAASEMEVTFDFELNGQLYRILKKRRRGKPTDMHFLTFQENGTPRALNGANTTETQQALTSLLCMDYETFLNSAYLKQGQADEFTKQKAGKRKEILAEILNLKQYEILETRAKDRVKTHEIELRAIEGAINTLKKQVAERPEYLVQLKTIQEAIIASNHNIQEKKQKLEEIRKQRDLVELLIQQRQDKELERRGLLAQASRVEAEKREKQNEQQQLQRILGQRESILSDREKLRECQNRRNEIDPQIEEYNEKRAEQQKLQSRIDSDKAQLEADIRQLISEENRLAKEKTKLEGLDKQAQQLEQSLQNSGTLQETYRSQEVELESVNTRLNELRVLWDGIIAPIKEYNEAIEVLEGDRSECPTCGTDLAGEKRNRVLQSQKEKLNQLIVQQKLYKEEIKQLKDRRTKAQEAFEVAKQQKSVLEEARVRLEEVQKQRNLLTDVPNSLIVAQKKRTDAQKTLAEENFALPTRAKKQLLDSDVAKLETIKKEYDTLRKRIQELHTVEERYNELVRAEEKRKNLIETVQALDIRLEEIHGNVSAIEAVIAELKAKTESGTPILERFKSIEKELSDIEATLTKQHNQEGYLTTQIQHCDKAAEELKVQEIEKKRHEQEKWCYNRLTECFGKKGIPQFIIENSLADLEIIVNDLLSKMTDNGMQLRLPSTRATGKGKEIDTLDIQIHDDTGERPYELYSGGEAFRINFAIRIGLSKLLAQRSGARLQTLILDEGFGTQDGKGREKLVQAIDSVKDDFEKILVITHVEELKDAFTQRIEITKDSRGSKIYVL